MSELRRSIRGLRSFGRESRQIARRAAIALRGEEGQDVVEFAVGAGVILVFTFGIMEMCILLFTYNSVSEAAREAGRWASVRGTTSGTTLNGTSTCNNPNITTCPAQASDIQNYAESLPGISSSNATVSVVWCNSDGVSNCVTSETNAKAGNVVKVTVAYTFLSVPFITNQSLTLSSTAENVIWE